MADDAADVGQTVRMAGGCGARVRVKPDALTRCLGNLVDNAVKYAGGAYLSCAPSGGQVVVIVRDFGPGIAADLLPRVFEPFLRGDSAAEGSGIGLAIARAQAAAIGGSLTLRNHPGGGVEASLTLLAAS
jgi:signal transduction histidine kinase